MSTFEPLATKTKKHSESNTSSAMSGGRIVGEAKLRNTNVTVVPKPASSQPDQFLFQAMTNIHEFKCK